MLGQVRCVNSQVTRVLISGNQTQAHVEDQSGSETSTAPSFSDDIVCDDDFVYLRRPKIIFLHLRGASPLDCD